MKNLILYLTSVLIWGSTWYVVKFQLGTVDPLLSIAYRFFLAAILIGIYGTVSGRFKKIRFTLKQHGFIALQGLFLFCLNYWLFYLATGHLTSGLVSVCFSTMAVMNVVNQSMFFRTPAKKQVVAGGLLGLMGIIAVFWHEISDFHFGDTTVINIGLCIIATYFASLGNITSMRNSRDKMPILETNFFGMLWGAFFCFAIALFNGADLQFDTSWNYLWSLAYLAVFGSVVAFISYLTLISRIGADRAGYSAVLFPIVALTISTFFENYHWTTLSITGVALILAGNVLALAKKWPLRK